MHPDQFYLENSLVRSACHRMVDDDDDDTSVTSPRHKFGRTHAHDSESVGSGHVPFSMAVVTQDVALLGDDFDPNDNRTAGHFGVPDAPCDAPYSLINATFDYLETVWKDKIDFIVWTGDNVRYRRPSQ